MLNATFSGSTVEKARIPLSEMIQNRWIIVVFIVAITSLVPLVALVILSLKPTIDVWVHLISTVLPKAVSTTVLLMIGVGIVTAILGVGTAWLVTMCKFPGRSIFDWALLIPLAVPTYIVAYAYVDILDFTGPVQSFIRAIFGFENSRDYWFPEIRSLGGTIFVMSVVLYPYVYLTARSNFLMQSTCTFEVSRTLGANPLSLFFRVALPLARPSIIVGISLALMECLNDIGAVEFFGVRTLTFLVYETWLNRGSLAGAAQISCSMLIIIFLLLWLERRSHRYQRFSATSKKLRPLPQFELGSGQSILAIIASLTPLTLGFIVPALLLIDFASRRIDTILDPAFFLAAKNSILFATPAALLTVCFGLILAYSNRLWQSPYLSSLTRIASIGYAVPGTVLAIGILYPIAALDNLIANLVKEFYDVRINLLLTGSGFALIYAYSCRFLAVSVGQIEAGFGKITSNLDMASRTLGQNTRQTLVKINIPLLKPVLISAALLVFVDCMKELPATLLLRPFNFETLATTVYAYASREIFEESALPALTIVLVGLIPVILLARSSTKNFRNLVTTRQNINTLTGLPRL